MNDAIQQLLIRSRPTLTANEEQTLFRRLRQKKQVLDAIDQLSTKKTHSDHCKRWRAQQAVEECRTILVESNLPLVVAIAKKANCTNVNFEDLVSEGNLTLLKCVDKFNPDRGYKFSTYCSRSLFRCFGTLGRKESKHHRNRENDYGNIGFLPPEDDLSEQVREVIEIELDEDQARVVMCRRGIGFDRPRSISDTATTLKMSKKKVVRLYESGTAALRESLIERGFAP